MNTLHLLRICAHSQNSVKHRLIWKQILEIKRKSAIFNLVESDISGPKL